MIRIEDLSDKSELIQKYYAWLLDSDKITLEKELDICLPVSHRDPFIYYPECLHELFHTECLQKLGQISQLSSMYQLNPGACHSRLEHSIAVFGKKQEEHLYLWMNNPEFVKYVEEKGFKKYLLAEEIKMLYHDVGHLPFSHPTEKELINQRGAHEEIGKNILLTNPEVVAAINKLGISDELRTVLTQNILNSSEHDDGNLDVDKKAYMQTDSIHIGAKNFNRYPIYSRKIAKINADGSYVKSPDGNIILTDSLDSDSKFIDVYSHSDIAQLEEILCGRESLYRDYFYNATSTAYDTIMGLIQSKIAISNINCSDLTHYINSLKTGDFISAKKYDEVDIFRSLINVGLHSDNPDVIDMVSLAFVPLDNWLNLMCARLDKTQHADFIRTIKQDMIKGNSRFAHNIRNKNFFDENVVFVEGEGVQLLRRKGLSHLIYHSHSLSAYDTSNPIYVEDENGKVFPLEEHPDRTRDWSDTKSYSNVALCITPWLKLQGLSPFKIADYMSQCRKFQSNNSSRNTDFVCHYFSNEDSDERS